MTSDTLLAEVFRRSDQLLAAWAVHTAVAVAVLGLVLAVPVVRDDRRSRWVLAGAFAFLAFANLEGMLWILKQWSAVATALHQTEEFRRLGSSDAGVALGSVVDAPPPLWVVPFHLALDVSVLWVVLRFRRPPDGPTAPPRPG